MIYHGHEEETIEKRQREFSVSWMKQLPVNLLDTTKVSLSSMGVSIWCDVAEQADTEEAVNEIRQHGYLHLAGSKAGFAASKAAHEVRREFSTESCCEATRDSCS